MFKHETKICHWWKQVTFTLAVKILKLNKGRWLQMQLHFILSSRLMKPTIAYCVLGNKFRAAKFVHCSVYIVHYRADTVCVCRGGHTCIRVGACFPQVSLSLRHQLPVTANDPIFMETWSSGIHNPSKGKNDCAINKVVNTIKPLVYAIGR